MELAVDWLAIFVHQLEGVGAIAIHVTVAIRDASITEQKGHLVCVCVCVCVCGVCVVVVGWGGTQVYIARSCKCGSRDG